MNFLLTFYYKIMIFAYKTILFFRRGRINALKEQNNKLMKELGKDEIY